MDNNLTLKEEYEIIFNNTENALFLLEVIDEEEFRFLRLNQTHEQLTGLQTEDIKGQTPREAFGPELGSELDNKYRKCLVARDTIEYEEKLELPAGEKYWLTTLSPVFKEGKIIQIVGSAQDITKEKENKQLIKKLNERFEQATEIANLGVWELNLETDGLIWNKEMYNLYGINKEESEDKFATWIDAIHPKDKAEARQEISVAIENQEEFNTDFRIVLSSGEIKYIKAVGEVVSGTGTQADRMVGINYEVTEQKLAERKLKEQKQSFQQLISTAPDCIFIKDKQGRYQLANRALQELLGLKEADILGSTDCELSSNREDDIFFEANLESLDKEEQLIDEEKIMDSDGNQKWFQIKKTTVDYQGARCLLGIARDITERKEAERKLEQYTMDMELKNIDLEEARNQAKQALQAKSEFLATMSHEIRTPMNSIIGMAELLLETDLNSKQKKYVDIFQSAGDNLLALINDILDLSKIEAGKIELEEKTFNLANIVESVAEMMAIKAYEKGLELPCRISSQIPNCLIGDESRLRQILINLIGNAIKFTAEGEVLIQVDLLNEIDSAGETEVKLIFEVTDTGIGISQEKQDKIFSSFTQADSSKTREYGGTGLGLTISEKLVDLMDGDIWVESQPEMGSSFYFTATFPKVEDVAVAEKRDYDFDFTELSLLAVDDNQTNLFILEEILKDAGTDVEVAHRPDQAIDILKKKHDKYQLLLLDFLMPDKNGFQLAKYIRENLGLSEIKIIIISSDFEEREEKNLAENYIDDYMMKPFKKKELLNIIAKVMSDEGTTENKSKSVRTDSSKKSISSDKSEQKRILLVEDVEDNRMLINVYLQSTDYVVEMAENGAQAVEKFKEQNYDLILMDIQMPVMDGYQATAEIRDLEEEQGLEPTWIIALTAHVMENEIEKILASSFDQHLAKPIKKNELLSALEDVD
ncbi:MAG: response regulator [Bacillota bacterium]